MSHNTRAAWRGGAALWRQFRLLLAFLVTAMALPSVLAATATATSVSVSPNPYYEWQSLTFTAYVTPVAPGTVTFKDGSSVINTVTVDASGKAVLSGASLGLGTHSITATYNGSTDYLASTSAAFSEVINQQNVSTVTLSASENPAAVNAHVTLKAYVQGFISGGGSYAPSGFVSFYDGSTYLGAASISGSYASYVAQFASTGSHSISAKYQGDPATKTSTGSMSLSIASSVATTTSLSVNPSTVYVGQTTTLTATVIGSEPTGTVTFKDGITVLGTASVNAGVASFTTSFATSGTHSLSAEYGGSSTNNPSTSTAVTLTANAKNTTATALSTSAATVYVGQGFTLQASVSGGSSPSGSVVFKDGSTTLGTVSLSGGVATLNTSIATAGAHSLTATYNGDTANSGSTSSAVSETVNAKTAASTSLSISPSPVTVGQSVTLTATINGTSPSGSVTFKDGSTTLGSAPISGNMAKLAASFSVGSHSLTATYSGDVANTGSTSSAFGLTVNKQATTLNLTVEPTSIYVGQTATLTATITGYSPSGAITFKDGATVLGTGTIGSGKAVLSGITLSGTSHSLSASYPGDGNNLASTSATLDAQVLPEPTASPRPVVNYEYDAEGNPTKTVQAPGVSGFNFTSQASYDTLDRAKDSTDARNKTSSFSYDGLDRLTQVTDPRTLVTKYPRNGLGDQTQLVSPDTGTTTYTYYADGRVKTALNARSITATYSYDALNRLKSVGYVNSGNTASQTFTYTYDQVALPDISNGIGRLTGITHPAGGASFGYDPFGRLTYQAVQINAATGINNAVTKTLRYGYDGSGHLTSITYPSGRQVTYTYTAGQLSAIGVKASASATTTQPMLSSIHWQPFGAADSWQWNLASGTEAYSRVFDDSGRLVRYRIGSVIRDLTYDEADRIKSYTHLDASTGTATAAATALNQSFGYDELGRLKAVSANGSSWSIGYDDNGNRTSVTLNGNTQAYTTAATSNRLSSMTNPARSFGYDAAGNTSGDSTSYTATYAVNGRMATLTKAGTTTSFSYDNFGLRVRKTKGTTGGTVLFVHDLASGHLMGEYDYAGNTLKEYVWMGDTPVAVLTPDPANAGNPPLVYYIHTDHLNTPRVVKDRSNNLRWRWMAEPFGTTAPESNPAGIGTFTFNLRFPGQYFDLETGLNYNWNRDYDPSTGRYVQSDLIGLDGGSFSTYSYVNNSPVQGIDPQGLDCTSLGGTMTCAYPTGGLFPGQSAPKFNIPTPEGFPASLHGLLYHKYDVFEKIGDADPDCVMKGMINRSTPGANPHPASREGTLNDARVFKSVPNPVMSYLRNDINTGERLAINVTIPSSEFKWGYVVHAVQNGIAHTYGEGNAWIQAIFPDYQVFADEMVWGDLMREIIKECSCRKK